MSLRAFLPDMPATDAAFSAEASRETSIGQIMVANAWYPALSRFRISTGSPPKCRTILRPMRTAD